MAPADPVPILKNYQLDTEAKAAPDPEHLEKINSTWEDDIVSELGRHVTHKFDTRVEPWFLRLWLLASINRSNIGNARIDGLATDPDLIVVQDSQQFGS